LFLIYIDWMTVNTKNTHTQTNGGHSVCYIKSTNYQCHRLGLSSLYKLLQCIIFLKINKSRNRYGVRYRQSGWRADCINKLIPFLNSNFFVASAILNYDWRSGMLFWKVFTATLLIGYDRVANWNLNSKSMNISQLESRMIESVYQS
jgi:hypothetical protein